MQQHRSTKPRLTEHRRPKPQTHKPQHRHHHTPTQKPTGGLQYLMSKRRPPSVSISVFHHNMLQHQYSQDPHCFFFSQTQILSIMHWVTIRWLINMMDKIFKGLPVSSDTRQKKRKKKHEITFCSSDKFPLSWQCPLTPKEIIIHLGLSPLVHQRLTLAAPLFIFRRSV